jgi:SSS family solute:Na+ symporter
MLPTIIIVVALYFVAMLGIGWYGRRYSKDFDGYLSMGKSGGVLLLMGGCIGANIGNGFVVGGAGGGAAQGLAGSAYGIACAFTALVAGVFLNDFIYKHNYKSLADYTRERYHSEVPGVIFDISTAAASIGLLAGQLMAGKALFEALGLPGVVGVVAISVVVFGYSQLAGIWGAFATSVVQTVVITAGLLLTTAVLLGNGAIGTIQAAQAAGTATPGALDFSGTTPAAFLAMALPVVLGMTTDQNVFMRVTSAKSAKVSKIAHLGAFVIMIPLALMPAFIGVYGNTVYGAAGDAAFFTVIMNELPAVICAIIIAAVLAAVMSTIDCGFITMSSVITRDILQGTLKKQYTEKQLSKITLVMNVLFMFSGIYFALNAGSILDMLNMFYSFLAAACFVPFVGGILWKKGTGKGAVAASLLGVATVILGWVGVPVPSLGGFFPCIPGAIGFVVVSLLAPEKK